MKITDANKEHVPAIVDIHMKTFTGFFLTFLGRGFLKCLYEGFILHEFSNLIIAVNENNKVIGFAAYSEDLSALYKYLIKKKLFIFAWFGLCAFVRKPPVIMRLFRAFSYSEKSKRNEKYAELSSIGVLPDAKQHGVGTAMISEIKNRVDYNKFAYLKLETDADNNDGVNRFYTNNGFELYCSYVTKEGRKMNEYRFYGDMI